MRVGWKRERGDYRLVGTDYRVCRCDTNDGFSLPKYEIVFENQRTRKISTNLVAMMVEAESMAGISCDCGVKTVRT